MFKQPKIQPCATNAKFRWVAIVPTGRAINRSQGRVSVIDGDFFYSPNCQRPVQMPSNRVTVTSPRHYDPDDFRSPQWWNDDFPYLPFMHLSPSFLGIPLQDLNEGKCHHTRSGYATHVETTLRWVRLEVALVKIIYDLSNHYGIPMGDDIMGGFSAVTCGGSFQYPSEHKKELKRTQGWFSVHLARLSYAIATAFSIDDEKKDVGIPQWYRKMTSDPSIDQVVLSGIRTSAAVFNPQHQSVGVFLDFFNPGDRQLSVDFLIDYNIPVWYRWDRQATLRSAADAWFARFAPLPEQLQMATTILLRSIDSLTAIAPEDNRPWEEFLATRTVLIESLLEKATDREQQSCKSRDANRPHPENTSVFVWELQDDGWYLRCPVQKGDELDTLNDYGVNQKVYCAYFNEWDCCDQMGEKTFEEEEDSYLDDLESGFEMGYIGPQRRFIEPLAPAESSVPSPAPASSSSVPSATPSAPSSSVPSATPSASSSSVPSAAPSAMPSAVSATPEVIADDIAWAPKRTAVATPPSTFQLEEHHVNDLLHDFFGFVAPDPMSGTVYSSISATPTILTQLASLVGLRQLTPGLEDTDLIRSCLSFMQNLEPGTMPLSALHDIATGNRLYLGHSPRLSRITRIGPTDLFALTLPAKHHLVSWYLTLTNSLNALFICRLDADFSEVEIC